MNQQQLNELSLYLEDNINPFLDGFLTPGTVEVYVNEICRKRIIQEYSINKRNSIHDLEELRRGFSVTIPDIKPTYRQLWILFAQNPIIDAKILIQKLTFYNENTTTEKHSNHCFKSNHILKNGALCPLSCLAEMIKESSIEVLQQFLYFVTGSTLITLNNSQNIFVKLVELENGEQRKFPFAATCVKMISFYLDIFKEYTKEESYSQFKNSLTFAITKGLSFGIK